MPKTDTPTPGTEIAQRQRAEAERATFERFLAAASEDQVEVDPEQVTLDIIRRVLASTTVDEVFGGAGAIHARDYLNQSFALTGVRFNESTIDGGGDGFYALLEGVDANGEPIVITCGAKQVIAQAWKFRDMGVFPIPTKIVQADKPTKAGFRPMWLERGDTAF